MKEDTNYDIEAGDELNVTIESDGQELDATVTATGDQSDGQDHIVPVDMNGTDVHIRFNMMDSVPGIASITDPSGTQTIGTVLELEVA